MIRERNKRPVPEFFVVSEMQCIAAFARAEALLEKPALRGVARQHERRPEMLARRRLPATAQLEVTHRRGIERIGGQPIAVLDRTHRRESTFGTIALCERNGTIERH